MSHLLRAVYQGGSFLPLEPIEMPEGMRVSLTVESPGIVDGREHDPASRARICEALIRRMMDHPLRPGAPRLSREALHEQGLTVVNPFAAPTIASATPP